MNPRRATTEMEGSDPRYVRRAALASELLFENKWRVQILCAIRNEPVRLGQLARLIPGASKKMLTENLRQLEAGGIFHRKDLSEIVLHVEYHLDPIIREAVGALLDQLANWGDLYLSNAKRDREQQ